MPHAITITVDDVSLAAELNDTPTAQQIFEALPIEASGSRWGDEIYFSTPVQCAAESDARDEFAIGELGYWPPGSAFCIFYGPTPVSHGDEPRMANPGTPIGQILDDATVLRSGKGSTRVRVEAAS